ncbi:MAG TPA: hypothetical protein VN663_15295 [Ramlibacter sp.]|nr:hypothetical protein [Ramlibacter sp.]
MLEFLRGLRQSRNLVTRLPGLVLAFLVAEVFYKFHSFTLECGAFLLTWLVIDVVIEQAARLLAPADSRQQR